MIFPKLKIKPITTWSDITDWKTGDPLKNVVEIMQEADPDLTVNIVNGEVIVTHTPGKRDQVEHASLFRKCSLKPFTFIKKSTQFNEVVNKTNECSQCKFATASINGKCKYCAGIL